MEYQVVFTCLVAQCVAVALIKWFCNIGYYENTPVNVCTRRRVLSYKYVWTFTVFSSNI